MYLGRTLEKVTENQANKRIYAFIVIIIFIGGTFSHISVEGEKTSQILQSLEPGVAILTIGYDTEISLAESTLISSLKEIGDTRIRSHRYEAAQLPERLISMPESWILVVIGHGTSEGIVNDGIVISWNYFAEKLDERMSPSFLLACYSKNAETPSGKIFGFPYMVDAEAGAIQVAVITSMLLNKLDDQSGTTEMLKTAAIKQQEKKHLLSSRTLHIKKYTHTAVRPVAHAIQDDDANILQGSGWVVEHNVKYLEGIQSGYILAVHSVFSHTYIIDYYLGDPENGESSAIPIHDPEEDPQDIWDMYYPPGDPVDRIDPSRSPNDNGNDIITWIETYITPLVLLAVTALLIILSIVVLLLIAWAIVNFWNPKGWASAAAAAVIGAFILSTAVGMGWAPTSTAAMNSMVDNDGDGLSQATEIELGTSDNSINSDGDNFNDMEEVNHGWDPTDNLSPMNMNILSQPSSTSLSAHSFWVLTPNTNRLKIYRDNVYLGYVIPDTDWIIVAVGLNYQAYNTIKVEGYHISDDGTWSSMVNLKQFTIYCSYVPPPPPGGGGRQP